MKKISILIILFLILNALATSVFAYSQMSEYLCDLGIKFYKLGRYDEALIEFKKALLVQPNYEPAVKYIQMLRQMKGEGAIDDEIIIPEKRITAEAPQDALTQYLDLIELQQDMIMGRQAFKPSFAGAPVKKRAILPQVVPAEKKISSLKIINLDENFSEIRQPIEIEQNKNIVIIGTDIQRFLETTPDIIKVERSSQDELLVTGKGIGYTYLHIWDSRGRWTVEFLGVFPKPDGPSDEELLRREEELARNFKLRYAIDWNSIETGRRINSLGRLNSYYWNHTLGLSGETPYGNFDTAATVRRLRTTTDVTYANFSLYNGNIGSFKDFTFRGGDYSPAFSNLVFPGTSLRGVQLMSPAFHGKINYDAFWGRESGGQFPSSHPELYKTKHSFLDGLNLNYAPKEKQNYKFSLVHGWGRDRQSYLNPYGYDLAGNWIMDKWKWGYELANDSERFAHIFNTNYSAPKINFSAEARNIDKSFVSITGSGWRQGQLGGLLNLNYSPSERLSLTQRLDVYQDRLYPALDNNNRWNEDFDWNARYQIDPLSSADLNYSLQNDLGKLSQTRYQNSGLGVSRRFKFLKDIYTFARYSHQDNKNFSSPSMDYINDKLNLGLRFSLIGDLFYYLNKEVNWLDERYYATHSMPHALETGLDFSSQIANTPLYGSFRFNYRDEEDTFSNLSFLSGEDYIEGYSELAYRKDDSKEIYGSCRVRNSWADNPNVAKRVEATFNAGMRYNWNTGFHWDSVCNIHCNVFKDLNSDGLREADEPPVEGVKIWLGKNKFQVTDLFGGCEFKGIRGRKAYVSIDMSTLPQGYLLTVPANQEVGIANNKRIVLDFGIITRSEISGIVFEDENDNGKYDRNEKGIEGITIQLDDGKKAKTDNTGRYVFPQAQTGEHVLSLDLESVPVYFLPKAAVTKKITLFEGLTYLNNIPLKRIEDR